MSRLAGTVPEPVRGHLEHCLAQALAGGAREPAWVLTAADHGWIARAISLPHDERARSVAAVSDEASLVSALRLGFGGALWLPPATPAMRAALAAAAAASPRAGVALDPSVVAELGVRGQAVMAVTWCNRRFWQQQLGEDALARVLASVARRLEVRPVILPWPALVLSGLSSGAVEAALASVLADQPLAPTQGIDVVEVEQERLAAGGVAALLSALAEREATGPPPGEVAPLPVRELPQGALVGWWSPCASGRQPAGGWLATPAAVQGRGHLWRLASGEGVIAEVADVLSSADVLAPGRRAVRVPGWAVRGLCPGSPSALLIERLGKAAADRGLPLWVPCVSQAGLRYLLRVGLRLWIDGPCVPSPSRELAQPDREQAAP